MNVISLSIIPPIIFSIVLARNRFGSGTTIDCFSFLNTIAREICSVSEPLNMDYDPDLPNIKFIDEFDPIMLENHEGYQAESDEPFTSETDDTIVDKVVGSSRRKNNPRGKGWYIRPYEEEYEDIIKSKFAPPKKNSQPFKSEKKKKNKQRRVTFAVPNEPEKKKLSIPHEDEKLDEGIPFFKFLFPSLGFMVRGLSL
ncbi:erythrocyte membrane antigen 1 [Plasmodium chabaudi chabaudi]|uniref:Erythrocyte membrane antigen 1 n=1 Tax=Plasmodium chabaudi chabaudi TaxID=31271 RepID=A0A1C6WLD8_PLACU|nr:erythrocyte membrane antigen 1 [Plasmodium chabaudi chabaudi]